MKKQRQTWSEPELRDARNQSLLAGDPKKVFGRLQGLDETLEMTLGAIQKLIRTCYDHDLSPLDQLRAYYPDFEWRYHPEKSGLPVVEIAQDADYLFLKQPQMDYSCGLITARRKSGGRPRMMCVVCYFAQVGYNYSAWPKDAIAKLRLVKCSD